MRSHANLQEPWACNYSSKRSVYSGVWEKHSDGNGSFTNKVSWLPCDSDVSQHKGPSSVCLHWVSSSGEQDVDSSNVKARNFQTLEGKNKTR